MRRAWGFGFAILLFLAAIVVSTQAWGQAAKFDVIKIDENLLAPASVQAMDRARKAAPGQRDATQGTWPQWPAFSAYYNKYLFPKMTDPKELANLPKMNEEILKDLRRAQSGGATTVGNAILSWSVRSATSLARGNYHPGVRINATLLLAQLNDQPPGAQPPVPAQATIAPLVGLYRDQTAPDGVRAAALIGLHRWALYGLPRLSGAARNGFVSMMLALANEPTPANRTPEGHAYLKRYALDILQVLYTPEQGKAITDAFVKLSTSPDEPTVISLYATAKLARLKEVKQLPAANDVAKAWTANIAGVFESEASRLAAMTPPKAAASQTGPVKPETNTRGGMNGSMDGGMDAMYESGMDGRMDAGMSESAMESGGGMMDAMDMEGGMGMGMYGRGGATSTNPQPPEVFASRRRLIHALECVKFGLTGSRNKEAAKSPAGLATMLPEENQLTETQLTEKILSALEELNKEEFDSIEKFATMLVRQSEELKMLSTHLGQEKPAGANQVDESEVNPLFPGGPGAFSSSPFAGQ